MATTLGQLHDAERGSSSHDDTPPPEVMDSTGASAASDSMSSGPAGGGSGQHQLQQQQRRQAQAQEQEQAATADMCRLLAQELCGAAQRVASLMDPTAAANFVGAMGRLGHYDWQTMRRVGAVAMQQSQVCVLGDGVCVFGMYVGAELGVVVCGSVCLGVACRIRSRGVGAKTAALK